MNHIREAQKPLEAERQQVAAMNKKAAKFLADAKAREKRIRALELKHGKIDERTPAVRTRASCRAGMAPTRRARGDYHCSAVRLGDDTTPYVQSPPAVEGPIVAIASAVIYNRVAIATPRNEIWLATTQEVRGCSIAAST